ncbi:MAG: DUF86 domain-containing protein [FCB group bacterium]|nr:DUF86 domain-containing protein [FCB group bacterium]
MIDAATQALEFSEGRTRHDLENDPPLKHLLVRNIEIMGEAASRVSSQLQEAHPEIPWRRMVSIRNRLVHAYFDIDLDILWHTVRTALPELLPKLKTLLDSTEDDNARG